MISEFMTGTVNIVIDPEREYAELTKNLGGDLVNAGGGDFIINPLQFKNVPIDDEDDLNKLYANDDGKGMSSMALHFKSIEVFFMYVNVPYGSMLITKVDAITNNPLGNAKFKVTHSDGSVAGSGDSESQGNTNWIIYYKFKW